MWSIKTNRRKIQIQWKKELGQSESPGSKKSKKLPGNAQCSWYKILPSGLKYVVIGGKKDFQVEWGLFLDLFWSRSGPCIAICTKITFVNFRTWEANWTVFGTIFGHWSRNHCMYYNDNEWQLFSKVCTAEVYNVHKDKEVCKLLPRKLRARRGLSPL